MHELEHPRVATIGAVRNSILAQSPGSRSAALVKRCDEAALLGDLRHHLFISHNCLLIVTNVFGRALRINQIVLNPRSGLSRSLVDTFVGWDILRLAQSYI